MTPTIPEADVAELVAMLFIALVLLIMLVSLNRAIALRAEAIADREMLKHQRDAALITLAGGGRIIAVQHQMLDGETVALRFSVAFDDDPISLAQARRRAGL